MTVNEILEQLENGSLRASEKVEGKWVVNTNVKEAILSVFKEGQNKEFSGEQYKGFVDKHNLPPRQFSDNDGVRLVPGGSSVRRGSFVSSGVIIMPPAYINIGAYVDQGSMVDSNCLVGSCAQIGKNVHLSAGVQIGGVLEPIGAKPVVIEDHAFIGAGSVVVEGWQISERAVVAPGVFLSKGLPVYDLVHNKMITDQIIPEGAIVVSGTRPLSEKYTWGKEQGLQVNCAMIIKYRDEKSDSSLELESILR